MQPFENQFLRLVPNVEPKGVLALSRPPVARSAGMAFVRPSSPNPTSLPDVSDFSITGTAPNAAYFMVDTIGLEGDRLRALVTASAAQIIRDIRQELQVTTGEEIYSVGLCERAAVRAEEFNQAFRADLRTVIPAIPTIPNVGTAPLPIGWMAILLWCTYFSDMPISVLRFPRRWKMPDMVTNVFPVTTGSPSNFAPFVPGDLRANPFSVQGTTIPVGGTVTSDDPSNDGNNGALLVGLGLAALLLLGGNK